MDEDENIEICQGCGSPLVYNPWLDCDLCPECDRPIESDETDD